MRMNFLWASHNLAVVFFFTVSCVFRCRMWPHSSVYYQEKTKWVTVYLCVFCLWIEQDSLDDPLFEHGPLTVYIICLKTSFPMLTLEATIWVRNREKKKEEKTDRGPNSGRQSQRQKGPQLLSQLTLILLPAKTLLHLSISGSINQSLSYKHTYNIPEVVM